jgi:predicted cupin superfamily sugar epimerase/catechol 2,3-dioxygenase-like lactoylglutathione lyase family enzyme
MSERVRQLISTLGLISHPERGFFAETYRAATPVAAPTHGGERSASTAIYFLVTADEPVTSLHRLKSDEVFHLYEGGPLDIVRLFSDGRSDVARLGLDLAAGERPQIVVPAGTWFGTELTAGASHCLVGCTVAPGFEFADFELADGPELEASYPAAADRTRRMRRPRPRPTLEKAFGYQQDAMNLPVADVDTALPFYERVLGFRVVSRSDGPQKSAVLTRDDVRMGLVESGGDPTQDGCAFHVKELDALLAEFNANGLGKDASAIDIERHGDAAWRVFYVVAPDGLCYWFGERQA